MSINLSKIKKLPDLHGVYFFLGRNKKILYIGKATSLKDRVKSYFSRDIEIMRSPLIAQMIEKAVSVDFKGTDSVLEALILEADLIRKFRPEFNTKEKDDKSFLCVVITKEEYPVVKLIRKKDLNEGGVFRSIFGPYPESNSIKEALKIIRKIFPYRDEKCKIGKRCFNFSIGLCPGCCVGEITPKEYRKTIKHIELFLSGKKKRLVTSLEKEMKAFAKVEKFEQAKLIRNQIFALEHIRDVSLIKKDSQLPAFRIEAYDIAHMSGQNMVGVMVVMEDGGLIKEKYRMFNIKGYTKSNDTGALKEMLTRRMNHGEWGKPDLVVVDGSVAQMDVARAILGDVPIVAVTKDDRHKAVDLKGDISMMNQYKEPIITVNAEAHSFAINFHKKQRNKAFLPKA